MSRIDGINQEWESVAVDFDPFAAETLNAPSTEPQREIWTAAAISAEANAAYNTAVCLRLRGALDVERMRHALQGLVARHDALRASFSADGQQLCIAPELAMDVRVIDLIATGMTLEDLRAREVRATFDLARAPLVRARIARVDVDDHALILTAHHLVCDGWSVGVLLNDLAALYNGAALEPAPAFRDYAALRAAIPLDEAAMEEAFWLHRLEGAPKRIEWPADFPPPSKRSFAADFITRQIGARTVNALRECAGRSGATLFATFAAAFAAWLHRLTGQDDLVIGIPAAGQTEPGFGELVGHCVSLLPVRSRFTPGQGFAEFVASFRDSLADAWEHRNCSMGRIVQRLGLPRDATSVPLVQVVLNTDRRMSMPVFEGLEYSFEFVPRPYENFEMFVNAVEHDGGLLLECHYDTNVFRRESAERRLAELDVFTRRVAMDPAAPMESVGIVGEAEQLRLLTRWGRGVERRIPATTVDGLLLERAAAHPDAIAVSAGDTRLTYRELIEQSARVCAGLEARGVKPGDVVGVMMQRRAELVPVLLGAWRAGCTYLPLDPEHPEARLQMMLEDAAPACVIADEDGLLKDAVNWRALIDHPGKARDAVSDPQRAAYIIYTSGSTGRPKGVLVPHHGVVNFLEAMRELLEISAGQRFLALTTLSFDIAVLEIWLPLVSGASTEIAGSDTARDAQRLRALLEELRPDLMQATPATWQMLLETGWRGHAGLSVLSGGEALPAALARELLARAGRVWNVYGPTETTVWSTCHRVRHGEESVPIGRPIANTRVYVLDRHGLPVPAGVPGELFIGGDGVAIGYHRRAELTAERFLPDPFNPGGRMYRTGDRVRFREDGTLEYLGRLDFQIKLRGYRIEPGEIETAVEAFPGITRCVVTVHRGAGADDARLVAYYQAEEAIDADALREALRARLPAYMVPQHFMQLEEFPLTGSGKVDRKLLPSPLAQAARTLRLPETDTEKAVAAIWRELLGVEEIDVADDFFALGGHSLLAARFVMRVRELLDRELSIIALFEKPRLAEIAAEIESMQAQPHAGDADTVRMEI